MALDPAAEKFARETVAELMHPLLEEHPKSLLDLLNVKWEVHLAVAHEAAKQRAMLCARLKEQGWTITELGDALEVTRARAQQLVNAGRRYAQERALETA